MGLDVVSDGAGFADEAGTSKFGDFLGYTIFDDKPCIVAGNDGLLFFISVGDDVEGGGGVDEFGVELEVEIILALNFGLAFRLEPLH